MTTFTFKGYAQTRPADAWTTENVIDGFKIEIYSSKDMSAFGYTLLGPVNVEIEVTATFSPRAEYIKVLCEKQKTLETEFHARVSEIQKQISELSALEHAA